MNGGGRKRTIVMSALHDCAYCQAVNLVLYDADSLVCCVQTLPL